MVVSVPLMGVAMDTEPYPIAAGLLVRKAVTWKVPYPILPSRILSGYEYGRRSRGCFRTPNAEWLWIRNRTRSLRDYWYGMRGIGTEGRDVGPIPNASRILSGHCSLDK